MIIDELLDWCKCGSDTVSAFPTLLWAVGAAALSRRLLLVLFRRSMFRRAPYWELALQHLLFVWMVIYSVHFWVVLVRLLKLLVDVAYDETLTALYEPEHLQCPRNKYMLEQCAVWCVSAVPLAACVRGRRRPRPPPLMIWITTSPWQRRELGPHGYYLQRPPPAAPPPPAPRPPRRAFSAPLLARPHDSTKHSKSI
ncbi:uncharacterized protein LOC125230636 [Leguminivora glycinivorella]|uniref:uncharacterized protein LOC125230636 n=1 Tax=Leguminivora glycinivorella TaxID=1035111 RepID=UPI00200E2D2C|nr:uncharacterized protein LOC125230636 [Leguminivora glycinivorella]